MSTECVYDERFSSHFLKLLNTTYGLVELRRKNWPSIKVETGAWLSFSNGQHSTKASVWDCVWAFYGQGMLFEGSLGRKCSTSFRVFRASGLTGGSKGEMNFIGCCNSAQIPLWKIFLIQDFEDYFFLENHFSNLFILGKSLKSITFWKFFRMHASSERG